MSAKRIKADPLVIGDIARAESAMCELSALERKRRAIVDDLNGGIDALKEKAKAEAAPIEAQAKALTDALGVFLKMNRAAVLGDKKTVELAFGFMGFRASAAICQMRGTTAEMSLERLKDAGLTDGIRLKEELNKDVMRGWPAERLALAGLVRTEKDQFFVELKEEQLGGDAA